MDGRAGLVIGSLSAAAASVAVLTAVALTTSAALADSTGTDVYASGIVVPASPTPTPSEIPEAVTPVVHTPVEEIPPAQVVDAPPPVIVGGDAGPTGHGAQNSEAAAIAAAAASGSWEPLRAFGATRGWSAERTEAWIERLVTSGRLAGGRGGDGPHDRGPGDRGPQGGPDRGDGADRGDRGSDPGHERRQDSTRPGHPGAKDERGAPGPSKKDRSSDSPVRGDR